MGWGPFHRFGMALGEVRVGSGDPQGGLERFKGHLGRTDTG